MSDKTKLPALSIPPEGYQLIRSFARANDTSISQAIRQLLRESPRLIIFAGQNNVDLSALDVGEWGGQRRGEAKPEQ